MTHDLVAVVSLIAYAAMFWIVPALSRPGMFFGVTVAPDSRDTWTRTLVMPHAHHVAPVRSASVTPRDTTVPGGPLALAGPFIIVASAALLIYVQWDAVPAEFPSMQRGAAGRLTTKSVKRRVRDVRVRHRSAGGLQDSDSLSAEAPDCRCWCCGSCDERARRACHDDDLLDLDPAIERLILRCLEEERERRPARHVSGDGGRLFEEEQAEDWVDGANCLPITVAGMRSCSA